VHCRRYGGSRQLQRRVEAGEWKPGEQIPSVSQLSARYGVSRTTVQKAVRMLLTDGLVVTRHGWGAFVAS
jgi:GntR family transcriptional regulator